MVYETELYTLLHISMPIFFKVQPCRCRLQTPIATYAWFLELLPDVAGPSGLGALSDGDADPLGLATSEIGAPCITSHLPVLSCVTQT